MPISHRPPAARVAVVALPRRRDYVSCRASDGGGGDGGDDTPGAAPWLQRPLSTRRAVKRSTARRSTAGSTAIREHAVTAVGIRTNETLQHTFRTGRRAAATRATHGRAGEAPPTVCQQPARVVRDESWDESWTPYYNLYQAPHVTLLVQMVPPGANPEIRIRKFIFCVEYFSKRQIFFVLCYENL